MEFKDDKKQLFRSAYILAKHIENHLLSSTTIESILSDEISQKRQKLIQKCESLIFLDHESLGKKSREIMWRQGCYNSISRVKQILWKNQRKLTANEMDDVREFLCGTINIYKSIIVKFENRYDLDLRYVINIDGLGKIDSHDRDKNTDDDQKLTSLEVIDYALKTIHFMLIALGDIHRYLYGFNVLEMKGQKYSTFKIAADFYTEAFKLNPTIGMAQNQLGTLYAGKNYDLDSVFHYLFALCCRIPFDLSEDNIGKIFQNNIDYIETTEGQNTDVDKVCVRDFVARFILNVDIFFYDKTVADLNNLCHFNLIELKKLLNTRLKEIDENFLFKITSILFFCMSHLKSQDSSKIHSLNALMVALTSELVDSCIKNIESYIEDYEGENVDFLLKYNKMYENHESRVTTIRQKKKNHGEYYNGNGDLKLIKTSDNSLSTQEKTPSSSSQDYLTQKSTQEKSITPNLSQVSKENSKNSSKKISSTKDRRRRKKIQNSSDSDSEDLLSDFESDDDKENIDSDFSDDSDVESDESFSSSDDDGEERDIDKTVINDNNNNEKSKIFDNYDSDASVIVEEEHIIFMKENVDNEEDVIIEEETIIFNNDDTENLSSPATPPLKLKYLPKYNKVNPNIILRFSQYEKTLKSLNLLFIWLRNNNSDILSKCHVSNPELIHKIMKLLNYLNIDVYTKKVFFDLSLIKIENIRHDSNMIFENRQSIPLSEDIALKSFDLFEPNQRTFDWEIYSKLQITSNEENLIRILKLVDFGFYLTKSYKFNYVFCKKLRSFVEYDSNNYEADRRGKRKRRRRGEQRRSNNHNNTSIDGKGKSNERNDRSSRRNRRRVRRARNGKNLEMQQTKLFVSHENKILTKRSDEIKVNGVLENHVKSPMESTKSELMGKLWLRDEIKNLESMVKKPSSMTPYLVMDAKCLTMYTPIVRNLVKTKKFIILIPNSVFSELDELKKYTEGARNAIRWLEQEFKRGNRHIRSQRDDETLPLPMIKFPKKLDRESSSFLQIVQFCHYIVSNNSSHDLLTLVTGESLNEKKCNNFSFTGIIEAIGVKTELIATFYSKYKKK